MPTNTVPVNGSDADRELEARTRDGLARYATLRIWGHALQIQARGGLVILNGHVRTRTGRETAESIIRQVPGVSDVKNELYVDTDLEMEVARALGQNPRTADAFPGILVGSGFGEIFLKGHVVSAEVARAAAEIAGQVPGVLRVVNDLAAPVPPEPLTPPAEELGRSQ